MGYHYGGGEVDRALEDAPRGSTVLGGRHQQHFYRVQAEMDCGFVVLDTVEEPLSFMALVPDELRILQRSHDLLGLYLHVASWLGVPIEHAPILIGDLSDTRLPGIGAYAYPDISYRSALALAEPLEKAGLDELACGPRDKVLLLWSSETEAARWRDRGFTVDVIDTIGINDDHAAVTARIAERWKDQTAGYMIGDPDLVSAWIPWLHRHRRLPLYGKPHRVVIERTEPLLRSSRCEVLGRQSEDWDILRMSELGKPMELVDPNRPVLPVLGEALRSVTPVVPPSTDVAAPSDWELRRYAEQGRVLATIVFWSGALREIETLAGVIDLVAITGLRAGVAVGARAFEYGSQACLDVVYQPLERGGVHPHLEVLLGSSGLGPAFEGHLGHERLEGYLRRALELIRARAGEAYVPEGWYAVMDGRLERLPRARAVGSILKRPRDWRLACRPYWDRRPARVEPRLLDTVRQLGFRYAISKTGHGWPTVLDRRSDFIAINHTAGVWEGWSPFVDIRGLQDVLAAERRLVRRHRPGWLLSTLDTCLWTFSYHQWERGAELKEIAETLVAGGETGELVNVTPRVVARYARILAEMGLCDEVDPLGPYESGRWEPRP